MSRIELRYQMQQGPYGTRQIVQYGRCDGGSATVQSIHAGVTVGEVVKLPNASGVVWKAYDGKRPTIYNITPSTISSTHRCVKIEATVNPMAPQQTGGVFQGSTVCEYRMVFQEIPE